MTAAWIVAWPQGSTAWDTEAQAERAADEMVKSKRTEFAVVYRAEVEGDA